MDPFEIELRGHIPSKKNSYRPRRGGKGRGFFKDTRLQAELDRLALQIPGEYRDLKLESPHLEWNFTYARANWDLDNAKTTVLDLLVQYGVLMNDNIKRLNGGETTHPAVKGDYDSVRVVITPQPESPRYIDPKRLRMQARLGMAPTKLPPVLSELESFTEEPSRWGD